MQALNVQVPFAVGRELLEGQLGNDIAAHLREIPTDVELGSRGGRELVDERGHADQAWRLLNNRNENTGIGWVIAGKLLARKRPTFIASYDSIVSCQFGAPNQVWLKLSSQLVDNGGELRTTLVDARATACADDEVSILRALDAVLRRRHVRQHRRDNPLACPQRRSLTV